MFFFRLRLSEVMATSRILKQRFFTIETVGNTILFILLYSGISHLPIADFKLFTPCVLLSA